MDKHVPNWSIYFMKLAETASVRSKDPSTKVGSCVVSEHNRVLGVGFNGMPEGMVEDDKLWERPTKYDYVCHAELNAILNCASSPAGGKLYVTLYPCKECAKVIASARIKKVYYKEHELNGRNFLDPFSQDIFQRCGIKVTKVR